MALRGCPPREAAVTVVPAQVRAAGPDALVRAVEQDGERIVLTRRGRPVAALLPVGAIEALDLLGRLLPDVADVTAGLPDPDPEAPGLAPPGPRGGGAVTAPAPRTVPVRRLRATLRAVVRAVQEGGERVVLTRHGRPVAALVPLDLVAPLPPALSSPLSAALGSPPADESPAATPSPEAP